MNKLCLVISFTFIFSSEVLIERAESVALNAYQEKSMINQDIQIYSVTGYPNIDNPSIYIFNIVNGGYILISSEDRMTPILGFSFNNHFQIENLPPQLENLLNYYTDRINYVRGSDIQSDDDIISYWDHYLSYPFNPIIDSRSVEPMLESTWNQDNPWNDICPVDLEGPGGNVLVGCVAVSMSQIMKYWEHPTTGSGSYMYTHPVYGEIEADFNTLYDWGQMANNYATDASSLLLYHAGVSIGMNYDPYFSSAVVGVDCEELLGFSNSEIFNSCSFQMENYPDYFASCQDVIDYYQGSGIPEDWCAPEAQCGLCEEAYMSYTDYPNPNGLDALKQFFGYNSDATFIWKEHWNDVQYYSDSEWIAMLKDQLDQGYPIIYSGFYEYVYYDPLEGHSYTQYIGHAWNVDGYMGDLLHCNWGWGGDYDGYYPIDNLVAYYDPYSYYNAMIINLFPSNLGINGDVNGDNQLDILDLVQILDLILLNVYYEIADVNEDGEIDILDLVALVNIILDV